MKFLRSLIEHDIVSKDKQGPKVLKKLPKMKRTEPPFSKGFDELIKVKRAKQIKNPAGGKVLKKDNTMEKGELGKKGHK